MSPHIGVLEAGSIWNWVGQIVIATKIFPKYNSVITGFILYLVITRFILYSEPSMPQNKCWYSIFLCFKINDDFKNR